MSGLYDLVSNTGAIFALLTVLSAAWAAIRRREAHRLDILLVAVAFAAALPLRASPLSYLGWGLIFAQPFLLLRLVTHFRDVPVWITGAAAALIAARAAATIAWPVGKPDAVDLTLGLWIGGTLLYAAAAFFAEGRRASGVTAKRLSLAAFGSATLAGRELMLVLAVVMPTLNEPLGQLSQPATGILLTCFFFAFATPRWLRARWQRAEQAKYLSRAAEHVAEPGARATGDLCEAVAGSVNHAATIVAVRERPAPDSPLVVRASTIPALTDLPLTAGTGLIGRVLGGSGPVSGLVTDCEPGLASRLRDLGAGVLAAPIGTSKEMWGVVLVVQRRGALFPEDDLALLAQLGRYAGIALDHAHLVAERRDRERLAADRRLREVESRMSLMLESIKDYALFVIDHRGRIVSWQPGAEHLFGYSASQMRDAPAAPLFDLSSGDFLAWLARAGEQEPAEREGPCRRRDGSSFVGATVIRRLAADADELEGFVAVTHDVTAHRDLEERLRQSHKLEAIGLLAGGIAHDFNNLLTAILGHADLLEAASAADDPRLPQIGEIQRAAERAASLTQQLLAFSRRQALLPGVVDLSALVRSLTPILRRLVGDRIEIVDATDPAAPPVVGDRMQLERIVVNLATNARDAMPDGGRLIVRTARAHLDKAAAGDDAPPGTYAMLEVTDTGIGMTEETRARVFEPFFTTKDMGRGTGLGLATVYGLVRQMGGAIRVASQPGEGTSLRLYFPAAAQAAAGEPVAQARSAVSPATLLLVEDDPAVRSFVRQSLERDGFRVLAAEHQASALELVAAHTDPIALIITDVRMPGGSGPELVQALAAIRPGVPALYMSGYADTDLSPAAGPGFLLQKPFSSADLLARVRQILAPHA